MTPQERVKSYSKLSDMELAHVVKGTLAGARMATRDALLELPVEEEGEREAIRDSGLFFERLETALDELLGRVSLAGADFAPKNRMAPGAERRPHSGTARKFGLMKRGGVTVECPREQAILALVGQLKTSQTYEEIAQALNVRGLRNRRGATFTPGAVGNIIHRNFSEVTQ